MSADMTETFMSALAVLTTPKCCDVCHEPVEDGCDCQDEYAREHDRYDER